MDLKVRRPKANPEDIKFGLKMENLWKRNWLGRVHIYDHLNKDGEAFKKIDFDIFSSNIDKKDGILLGQVCVEGVRLNRKSLSINKLNFKEHVIDDNIHKPHAVWYVQVFEDQSIFYFETIKRLQEYREDEREWQEHGIFRDWINTAKERERNGKRVLERVIQIPLDKLQYRIMRGKNANYQSLCKRNTD